MSSISVVTVCMNRREHLQVTAARVAAWPWHAEYLIVDWSRCAARIFPLTSGCGW